jgi:hypothetical protein
MFGWIAHVARAIGQNPARSQVLFATALYTSRAFERLSHESKAKVENAVRWGIERTARFTLTTVLGEVSDRVFGEVAKPLFGSK